MIVPNQPEVMERADTEWDICEYKVKYKKEKIL